MTAPRYQFVIPDEYDGRRLDRVLPLLLPDQSRNALVRLIEEGRVSVNARPVTRKSTSVVRGEVIDVEIPPPVAAGIAPQDLPLTVLYQDDDLAVIDKPAGLVVHPAAGHADSTLVNALLHHLGDLSGVGGTLRPGIVHRLDKDTSGVLVVAKHDTAHRSLTLMWNTENVKKEYLALVYGTPKAPGGTIEQPIGRDPRDRKRMAVVPGGRHAITLYETVEALRYASLLRCTLRTGRTHQIRVHLKALGHPLIGDPLYSGPQWKGIPDKRLQKAISHFPRQALHAHRLSFPHPRTGAPMTFESPLPPDMAELLGVLRAT